MSNRQSVLIDCLKKNFTKSIIVVPNDAIKRSLMQSLALDPKFQIAAGMRFLNLNMAVEYLLSLTAKRLYRFPQKDLLSLHLQTLIPKYRELEEYLEGSEDRLIDLANHLSSLFIEYSQRGDVSGSHWQARLYREAFCHFDSPKEIISQETETEPINLVLFCINEMPKSYFDLFERWNADVYFLSPSSQYWGDLYSEKIEHFLQKKFEKEGVSLDQRTDWAAFSEDLSPLILNNIEYGRPLYLHINEHQVDEQYVLPKLEVQQMLLDFEERDWTLDLFVAPTLLREVENCLRELQRLGKASSDILVYVSNVSDYLPYIQLVFGSKHSPYGYTVEGIERLHSLRKLYALLHLHETEFTPNDVLALLPFNEEEMEQIRSWVAQTHIRRGLSDWEDAFHRLCLGLAMESESVSLPLSSAELLGEFIANVKRLYICTHPSDSKTAREWSKSLRELILEFLGEVPEEFEPQLQRLSTLSSTFSYKQILHSFETFFHSKSRVVSSEKGARVRFLPLQSGNAVEADVIAILGMDESRFPKTNKESSLCLYAKKPSPAAADRYLFLELLALARESIFLSYTEEGELSPSIILQELDSQHINLTRIAPFAFQEAEWNRAPSFNPSDFHLARHYYSGRSEKAQRRWPVLNQEKLQHIELSQLRAFARHPLQFFLKHSLDVNLSNFSEVEESEREFVLSYLDQARLRREAFFSSDAIACAKRDRMLDELSGAFIATLEEQLDQDKASLAEYGIENVYEIILDPAFQEITEIDDSSLGYPPLSVGGVEITGVLFPVSDRGLVHWGESKKSDLVKVWPDYLVYSMLDLPGKELICLKDKKSKTLAEDPKALLLELLDYFERSRQSPSLLLPEWVDARDQESLEKRVVQSFTGSQFIDPDAVLTWAFADPKSIPVDEIQMSGWHERI